MNERCPAVFLNELPSKEKDPRSFPTPCQVLEKHKEEEDLAADHLSRFENPQMEVLTEREIADKFSDEHLMVLKSKFNNDEPCKPPKFDFSEEKKSRWRKRAEEVEQRDLDNSTNNVLIPLDSWTSGLLVYRLPLSVKYSVSYPTEYGISSSLSNTAYSYQQINTAYPLPLDTAYRSSGTETKIIDFRANFFFLPSFRTNHTDCLSLVSADSNLIRRIRSNQYAISTGQNSTLLYKSRQTTVPFLSRLDNHYYDEEGNYGPKFTEAYGASHINNTIPRKEKDPGSFTLPYFINDFCFDNALVDLGASVSVMPFSTYLKLGLGEFAHTRLTVESADRTVKYLKGIAENVLVGISKFTFLINFIILDMPEDVKVPLILKIPFLSIAHDKIDVYKRKITLRVREEKIIFKIVKPASSIIKRVYMLSLKERMELDLEARLMGETLVLNRSLDPFSEDYIKLNDLNELFELRRNQRDDLMPTIEECKVIEEFRTRYENLDTRINDYPSYCDEDKKIHIDFLEDMDAYRDNEMGDIIFGEPFLREVGIKTKRFEGIITLYNGGIKESNHETCMSILAFQAHVAMSCTLLGFRLLVCVCVASTACWSVTLVEKIVITILKTNTPYPSRKIRRIRACTHQRPQKIKDQYAVSRGLNTPYSRYGINIIFWKISNVVPTPRNPQYAVSNPLDTPY
ncbi:retrovirus-related pol polyprotein from transposon TNT 1-94 [Tanacetum coccineum]